MGAKTHNIGGEVTETQENAIDHIKTVYAGEIESIWAFSGDRIEFHIKNDARSFGHYEMPEGYKFGGVSPLGSEIEIQIRPKE